MNKGQLKKISFICWSQLARPFLPSVTGEWREMQSPKRRVRRVVYYHQTIDEVQFELNSNN